MSGESRCDRNTAEVMHTRMDVIRMQENLHSISNRVDEISTELNAIRVKVDRFIRVVASVRTHADMQKHITEDLANTKNTIMQIQEKIATVIGELGGFRNELVAKFANSDSLLSTVTTNATTIAEISNNLRMLHDKIERASAALTDVTHVVDVHKQYIDRQLTIWKWTLGVCAFVASVIGVIDKVFNWKLF